MPEATLTYSDEEREVLEQVRLQQGLTSIDQAAEWLVKARLRQQTQKISGRPRALYPVSPCP